MTEPTTRIRRPIPPHEEAGKLVSKLRKLDAQLDADVAEAKARVVVAHKTKRDKLIDDAPPAVVRLAQALLDAEAAEADELTEDLEETGT